MAPQSCDCGAIPLRGASRGGIHLEQLKRGRPSLELLVVAFDLATVSFLQTLEHFLLFDGVAVLDFLGTVCDVLGVWVEPTTATWCAGCAQLVHLGWDACTLVLQWDWVAVLVHAAQRLVNLNEATGWQLTDRTRLDAVLQDLAVVTLQRDTQTVVT